MRKDRFTEDRIIAVLAEGEAGAEVKELCRGHGIRPSISVARFAGLQGHEGHGVKVDEVAVEAC